jgi:hypothetical protein
MNVVAAQISAALLGNFLIGIIDFDGALEKQRRSTDYYTTLAL